MTVSTPFRSMSVEAICYAAIERSAFWQTHCMMIDVPVTPDLYEHALKHGVFPWNDANKPRTWWSPDPRAILELENFHISRSLAKCIRQRKFMITFDEAFDATVERCAIRKYTWLDPELRDALSVLHKRGIAHSAESWRDGELVGGVYGMAVNGLFIGDSMFHQESNASKVALAALISHLKKCGFRHMDCQVLNKHTESLGTKNISRDAFRQLLVESENANPQPMWQAPK